MPFKVNAEFITGMNSQRSTPDLGLCYSLVSKLTFILCQVFYCLCCHGVRGTAQVSVWGVADISAVVKGFNILPAGCSRSKNETMAEVG